MDIARSTIRLFATKPPTTGLSTPQHLTITFEGVAAYRFNDICFGHQNVIFDIEETSADDAALLHRMKQGDWVETLFAERVAGCRAFRVETSYNMDGVVFARAMRIERRPDPGWLATPE